MKKLALSFHTPQIEINGITFDVLKSDATIIRDMLNIDARFANRDMSDSAVVLEKNDALVAYLDELLGAGAVEKIISTTDGLALYGLGLAGIDRILGEIVQASGKAYSEAIALKYDE